jgi:hypothetical protein
MERIGEDLLLLLLTSGGHVANVSRAPYALMGSELVRLAAAQRIDIREHRVIVLSDLPVGHPGPDAALASLVDARKPPKAGRWVGHPRADIVKAYLHRLAAQGTVRHEPRRFLLADRWYVLDVPRVNEARRRLDTIAASSGPVPVEDAAFAGLAHAAGLGELFYRGWGNRAIRKRLEQIAKGQWTARAIGDAIGASRTGMDAAARAAIMATTDAAVRASIDAAVDSAVQASVSAASEAAHHAHDAGAAAGHHGGH